MISPSILEAIKSGKSNAFQQLYESCIAYVFTIVKRYVSNESDYPDVIQEIFARVFLHIKTYNPAKGEFKPWLRRLAINQCLQHYRQQQPQKTIVPLEIVTDDDVRLDEKLTTLTKKEVENLLQAMPAGYRRVFMMVAIDELPHKEASQMLGISVETSRSQYSRAKHWLRKHLFKNKPKVFICGL